MSLVPVGDPRVVGDAEIQYVGDKSHSHEGGHRIAVAGRSVLVLPDGRTTARNRSHVITRVLHAFAGSGLDPTEALIGALVVEGATSIEVDGQRILADGSSPIVSLRLDVLDNEIRVTSLGGGVG